MCRRDAGGRSSRSAAAAGVGARRAVVAVGAWSAVMGVQGGQAAAAVAAGVKAGERAARSRERAAVKADLRWAAKIAVEHVGDRARGGGGPGRGGEPRAGS